MASAHQSRAGEHNGSHMRRSAKRPKRSRPEISGAAIPPTHFALMIPKPKPPDCYSTKEQFWEHACLHYLWLVFQPRDNEDFRAKEDLREAGNTVLGARMMMNRDRE
jgi:hypothetical protein